MTTKTCQRCLAGVTVVVTVAVLQQSRPRRGKNQPTTYNRPISAQTDLCAACIEELREPFRAFFDKWLADGDELEGK